MKLSKESQRRNKPFLSPQTERTLIAYRVMNKFIQAFIEHVRTLTHTRTHVYAHILFIVICSLNDLPVVRLIHFSSARLSQIEVNHRSKFYDLKLIFLTTSVV